MKIKMAIYNKESKTSHVIIIQTLYKAKSKKKTGED
jgi:hypothetical protein